MRRSIPRRLASLSFLLSFAVAAAASAGGSVDVSIDSNRPVDTCGDVRIRFDFHEAARAEDTITLPASAAPLHVELPANSGIRVTGGSWNEFSVTACKAAAKREALEGIRVAPRAASLDVGGPAGEDWLVFLIVKAPRDAALDLAAKNGSIGVEGIAGKITVRTTNGPIELRDCSGEILANAANGPISLERCTGSGEARAVNGPVHISGREGSYRLSTQNGPISVELEGERWDGSLEARAVNGPLHLQLSEDYRSGVLVQSRGSGPFSCAASACRTARKSWDDDGRRIEFGDSEPVVRLSTRNGPVSVEPAD